MSKSKKSVKKHIPATEKKIYQLRITLNRSKPPIWRKVALAPEATLGELHEVIQIAMGWLDGHLHQFILDNKSLKPSKEMARQFWQGGWNEASLNRIMGQRRFVPKESPFGDDLDIEGEDERAVTLAEVFQNPKDKLIYEYDFGDGWEHTIELQKILQPDPDMVYPICLGGKKACPPEDCGGVWGYYNLLEIIGDPDHEDHEHMIDWLGEGFDPDAFDLDETNATLAKWAGQA